MTQPSASEERRRAAGLIKRARSKGRRTREELQAHEGLLGLAMDDLRKMYQELLETQSRLMQADKLATIGLLAAGIIHEINNPLMYAQGNLAFLDRHSKDCLRLSAAVRKFKSAMQTRGEGLRQAQAELDDALKALGTGSPDEYFKKAEEGIDRITRIVSSLRIFSRSSRSKAAPEDLHQILDGVVDIVWNQIKHKARLEKEYGYAGTVTCDAQAVGQVFMNLLVNAAQAIERDGVIRIRTSAARSGASIEISDTGGGIPAEILEKIFEPFFTTKDPGKGTGLGLSICRDIVRKHSGTIDVRSQPGKGTVFTVWLPANPS